MTTISAQPGRRAGPPVEADPARAAQRSRCVVGRLAGSGCSCCRPWCCTASTRSIRSSPATGTHSWSGTDSAADKRFVGFSNYRAVFADPLFWNSFKITIIFMLLVAPARVILSFLLAIVLNSPKLPLSKLFRTVFFLPVVTTTAIVGVVMQFILDPASGPINSLLMLLGFEGGVDFLGDTELRCRRSSVVYVWKFFGITMIYWLAALQTIPHDIYEAARIDGAGFWQMFRHITVPMLKPFLIIITAADDRGHLPRLRPDADDDRRRAVLQHRDHRDLHLPVGVRRPHPATRARLRRGGAVRRCSSSRSALIQLWGVYAGAPAEEGLRRMSGSSTASARCGHRDGGDSSDGCPGGSPSPSWSGSRSSGSIPFVWMLSASLKDNMEMFAAGLKLIPE